MNPISRREFVIASSAVASQIALGQVAMPPLTAGDVVNRIKQNVGVPGAQSQLTTLLPVTSRFK